MKVSKDQKGNLLDEGEKAIDSRIDIVSELRMTSFVNNQVHVSPPFKCPF
jgi:hypothetical protein